MERAEAKSESGVISALRRRERDGRIGIFVGRRSVGALEVSGVEALGLREGAAWTEELCAKVKERMAFEGVRGRAVKFLAKRRVSKKAMLERLEKWKVDEAIAKAVLGELDRAGLVDDAELAKDAAARMVETKPAGKTLIVERLKRRGIDAPEAERAADVAGSARSESEGALELARQTLARQASARQSKGRAGAGVQVRVYQALLRRGYEEETALHSTLAAMREAGLEVALHERDQA